jgi:AraC family transcriptional regulator
MENKVVNLNGFKAVGLTYFGSNCNGEIPSLWGVFNARYKDIKQKSSSMLCYGICEDAPDPESRFHYTACAEVDSFEDVPEGMDTKVISPGKYLVYTYTGTIENLGEFYNEMFSSWIPATGYEMDLRPQLELYDDRFMKNGEFDIFIPIK